MLVGHLADVLEIGKFPIAQDGCPNHLAHSATIIGMGDSEPCHRGAQVQLLITGRRHRLHSLVVLDPVTNPLLVECLRGFIHDELQAHLLAPVASNDLDKSGSTPALLPKALAVLAHIATGGDTLLFANDFPRGDGTQDQSTLSFGPKDVLVFSPHLLFGILAHHRVHIFNGDVGAWLIRIFHQQRSPCRGVSADGSCTQRRSPNWQVWIQTKSPNGLIGVVQLAIKRPSIPETPRSSFLRSQFGKPLLGSKPGFPNWLPGFQEAAS